MESVRTGQGHKHPRLKKCKRYPVPKEGKPPRRNLVGRKHAVSGADRQTQCVERQKRSIRNIIPPKRNGGKNLSSETSEQNRDRQSGKQRAAQKPTQKSVPVLPLLTRLCRQREDDNRKRHACVCGDTLDPYLYTAFQALEYALVEGIGAPVKEALVKAGIGTEIEGSYNDSFRQPFFDITAKNANDDQKADGEKDFDRSTKGYLEGVKESDRLLQSK